MKSDYSPCESFGICPLWSECAEEGEDCFAFRHWSHTRNLRRERIGLHLRKLKVRGDRD